MFEFTQTHTDLLLQFDNELYVVIDDIPIPIEIDITKIKYPLNLYSTPAILDKYPINTLKKVNKTHNLAVVLKVWSLYPINSRVDGYINTGKFVITKIKK